MISNERFVPLRPRFQPMLFVAAAFSLGIAGEPYLHAPLWLWFASTGGCFFLGLFSYLKSNREGVSSSLPASWALLAGMMCAGALLVHLERLDRQPQRLRELYQRGIIRPTEPVDVVGRLSRPPEDAPQRVYLDVDVERIQTLKRVHPARGQMRLMVPLVDEVAEAQYAGRHLRYGDRIRVLTFLRRASRYRNPGSPNYTEYLDQHGYDVSGVVKSPRLITVLARGRGHPLWTTLYRLKRRAELAIDELFSGRAAALLKAVLLGNRHFIDRQIAERFRAGGAFHVLVISGMHVGFLAGILLGMLSLFGRNRWWRFLVVSGLLWVYALMIGLDHAPVVRATTMITAALAAPLLFRSAQAANTIGLAAFVLLVIDPEQVFAPGFQLTFLAVLSMSLLAFPVIDRLRAIGSWQPSEKAPQPPRCAQWVRQLAELIYWDQRAFEREMQTSPITFQLDKSPWALRLNRWPGAQWMIRALVLSVIVSATVQIGVLPAMVLYFHRVAPGGIVLNIWVTVGMALFVISALLAFAMAELSVRFALPVVAVGQRLVEWIPSGMEPWLRLPWASFRVAEYTGWARAVYGMYLLALVGLACAAHRWQPLWLSHLKSMPERASGCREHRLAVRPLAAFGLVFLVCLAIIVTHPDGVVHRDGWLTISFLDVDQGDAALVQFPRGTTMLIDSGGRWSFQRSGERSGTPGFVEDTLTVGEAVVSNFLWARGLQRIDYILPTHADIDHIQGFGDVMNNFSVGRVLLARAPVSDPEFEQFERVRRRVRLPVQFITAGDRFRIEGVTVDILWPPPAEKDDAPWGNDEAVVVKMTYGRRTFLLTGDISGRVERALVAGALDLKSDVLKVPHHGSRTSSTEAFVRRVRPRYAVISVGEHSPFGHPHPEVVARYQSLGATILQTGRWGTITIRTDGHNLEVLTFVPREFQSSEGLRAKGNREASQQ